MDLGLLYYLIQHLFTYIVVISISVWISCIVIINHCLLVWYLVFAEFCRHVVREVDLLSGYLFIQRQRAWRCCKHRSLTCVIAWDVLFLLVICQGNNLTPFTFNGLFQAELRLSLFLAYLYVSDAFSSFDLDIDTPEFSADQSWNSINGVLWRSFRFWLIIVPLEVCSK